MSKRVSFIVSACFLSIGFPYFAWAQAGALPNGATALLKRARDLGALSASAPVEVTIWLKLRDTDGLRRATTSQSLEQAEWLSEQQVDARYSPPAEDVATVRNLLTSQGFRVEYVGPHNLFVKAAGTATTVQSAFGVQLHQFQLNATTFYSALSSPTLPGAIAPLVSSIGGLTNLGAAPNFSRAAQRAATNTTIARPSDAEGLPPLPIPLSAKPNGLIYSAQCFYPSMTLNFTGNAAAATYAGRVYGASINNTIEGTIGPCGYEPSDLQTAYNLDPLYKAGLDGSGQTIAIVDAYGSITVANDLAAFSAAMGLPPPNLTIIGTATESGYSGDANSGWADETTADVEWVHAIAPGARILLVIAPTNSFDDLFAAIVQASGQPGVAAISNSWAGYESATDIPLRRTADGIFMMANAKGQAINFATGDAGNETIDLGYADVNFPASSPYVTAVGGVSVSLDSHKQIEFQTSWGNNITEIADTIALGSPPIDPPSNKGFIQGGGGGTSNVYPSPGFQRGLGGQRRQIPDISWTADPFTGAEIIETLDAQGGQYIQVGGGTSLSTPMFSALWGIATQRAGHPLGQAAPYLYELPPGAITDVGAVGDARENVRGVLTDAEGVQNLSPWDLALPLQNQQSFLSALYNSPYTTRWYVLTFGTDSTLQAGVGWDPATGLGTPSGWSFVQAFGHTRQ